MKRVLMMVMGLLAVSLTVLGMTSIQSANAAGFVCPSPALVNCVPAVNNLGSWTHNGGQMTGNTFAPNNQCANVIRLEDGQNRLLCCYTKCGVFYMDVPYRKCAKRNESRFECY